MIGRRAVVLCATVVGLIVGRSSAGDLNPPAGPVSSTMKTLTEVEPRTPVQWLAGSPTGKYLINQPGSYYLIDNITADAGKNGIEIDADNVTLDLRGFALNGDFGLGATGIVVVGGIITAKGTERGVGPPPRHDIAVYNGAVEAWGNAGIDLTNATNSRVERIRAFSCFGGGITVFQNTAVVDCMAESNGGAGIRGVGLCTLRGCSALYNNNGGLRAGTAATVSGCNAESNTFGGIFAGAGSTIANCAARVNLGNPAARGGGSGSGFELEEGCTLANCSSDFNQNDGYNGLAGCSFTNCTSRSNLGSGFNVTDDVHISHCTATSNGFIGIWVNGGTIADSTSNRNGSAGISSFFQPLSVSHCNISYNGADGVFLDYGGRVEGCTASENGYDGIRVADDSVVADNKCSGNGFNLASAGVHATGVHNRIDGNSVINQERGIDVDSIDNVVIHNSAGNNTVNYDIVAGNDVGPIGTAAALTSPWGNISFAAPAPTCSDGIQNGSETDIDCGGGTCPPCNTGQNCFAGSDCASGICSGGVCQP